MLESENLWDYIIEALAKLFVIPEFLYPRYKHSGTDMVFQALRTRFLPECLNRGSEALRE